MCFSDMSRSKRGFQEAGSSQSQDIFSAGTSRSQSSLPVHHSQPPRQNSQSQSASERSGKENVVNINELANDIVLFFLNYHYCMKPIKKTTITKYFKNMGPVKVFNDVMERVKKKLYDVSNIFYVQW